MNFRMALSRALRLTCPECGRANIADGWLSTTASCSACGADLNVETGYFLGAIYFNYGATVLIVFSAAIPLIFVAKLPTLPVVAGAVIFCIAFPLWFFRYARSLWLAMDHYYHVRRREAAELSTLMESNTSVSKSDDNSQIGCICPLCHDRFTVAAELSNKWGKCPNCYGDVLFIPAFDVEHDSKSTNSQAAVRGGVNAQGIDEAPVTSMDWSKGSNSWTPVSYRAMGRWMLQESVAEKFVFSAPFVSRQRD